MLECILSRENLLLAIERVERNKGSHGIDEMTVESLREYFVEHWHDLKEQILSVWSDFNVIKGNHFKL